MNEQDIRAAFEKWFSEGDIWPGALVRNEDGCYRLMQTQAAWVTWQAAAKCLTEDKGDPGKE